MSERHECQDHTARERATKALTKIDAHEGTCAERWGEARNQLSALFRQNRQLLFAVIGGLGSVVVFLAGLIVTLLMRGHA